MEWVQPDISFFGEMFLNTTRTHSNFTNYEYTSNLEFGLKVFNCKPLDSNMNIQILSLIQYQKKQDENGTETQLDSSSSTRLLAPTQLLSYTEVTQYYPGCWLNYLPPSCSLAHFQSSNWGGYTAQGSSPRGSSSHHISGPPTLMPFQPVSGSFSKHPSSAVVFLFPQTLYSASQST